MLTSGECLVSHHLIKDTVTAECLWFCGLFGVGGVFGVGFFVSFCMVYQAAPLPGWFSEAPMSSLVSPF